MKTCLKRDVDERTIFPHLSVNISLQTSPHTSSNTLQSSEHCRQSCSADCFQILDSAPTKLQLSIYCISGLEPIRTAFRCYATMLFRSDSNRIRWLTCCERYKYNRNIRSHSRVIFTHVFTRLQCGSFSQFN